MASRRPRTNTLDSVASPSISDRIASLHHATLQHSGKKHLSGSKELVLPGMRPHPSKDEATGLETSNETQGIAGLNMEWSDRESWVVFPNYDDKENSRFVASEKLDTFFDPFHLSSSGQHNLTDTPKSNASINGKIESFLSHITNLQPPKGASMKEKEELENIVHLVKKTFTTEDKNIDKRDKEKLRQAVANKGIPQDIVDEIVNGSIASPRRKDALSTTSSQDLADWFNFLWDGGGSLSSNDAIKENDSIFEFPEVSWTDPLPTLTAVSPLNKHGKGSDNNRVTTGIGERPLHSPSERKVDKPASILRKPGLTARSNEINIGRPVIEERSEIATETKPLSSPQGTCGPSDCTLHIPKAIVSVPDAPEDAKVQRRKRDDPPTNEHWPYNITDCVDLNKIVGNALNTTKVKNDEVDFKVCSDQFQTKNVSSKRTFDPPGMQQSDIKGNIPRTHVCRDDIQDSLCYSLGSSLTLNESTSFSAAPTRGQRHDSSTNSSKAREDAVLYRNESWDERSLLIGPFDISFEKDDQCHSEILSDLALLEGQYSLKQNSTMESKQSRGHDPVLPVVEFLSDTNPTEISTPASSFEDTKELPQFSSAKNFYRSHITPSGNHDSSSYQKPQPLLTRAYASDPIREYWRNYTFIKARGSFDSVSVINEFAGTNASVSLSASSKDTPKQTNSFEQMHASKVSGSQLAPPASIWTNQSSAQDYMFDRSWEFHHDSAAMDFPRFMEGGRLYKMDPLLSCDSEEDITMVFTEEENADPEEEKTRKFSSRFPFTCFDVDLIMKSLSGFCSFHKG